MERVKTKGLKWIRGKPYWVAENPDFKPRTVNLSRMAEDPDRLRAACFQCETEMAEWADGKRKRAADFDGSVKSLFDIYQNSPESSFQDLRPGSLRPYRHYLKRLTFEIGDLQIDSITGADIKRWHGVWSKGGELLAAATMMRAVLEAALAFGVTARIDGCSTLLEVLRTAKRRLPRPKRREVVLTADEVTAARASAHERGQPASALAYALVFETTLRLWDVIGQWWPIEMPGVSDVVDENGKHKWFGLRWENIGPDLVLRYTPSKTSDKTGKTVTYPLTVAPMVMEELANWPEERRSGPVVVSETTGLPFMERTFSMRWAADRKAAGIDSKVWARDLRASAITEAREGDVSLDDAAKVAGHASTKTTAKVYDRANLAAAERFAKARVKGREK